MCVLSYVQISCVLLGNKYFFIVIVISYNGCDYLSMLGLKLNHVTGSKSGHWSMDIYHWIKDIFIIHIFFSSLAHCILRDMAVILSKLIL